MEGKAAAYSDFSLASHTGPSGGAQQFETNLCTLLGEAGGYSCVWLPKCFLSIPIF